MSDPIDALSPAESASIAWQGLDTAWYRSAYPAAGLAGASFDQVRAYHMEHGIHLGHAPNMYFDERWYLLRYPDIAAQIRDGRYLSGYHHYFAEGHLGRSAHWLYDDDTYALALRGWTGTAPEQTGASNRYDHYLKIGARAGLIGHLLFDPGVYACPDRDTDSAFSHFLRGAWFDGREAVTSVYFDPAWFRQQYQGLAAHIDEGRYACALHAYQMGAGPQALDPLMAFSEAFYRATYPDVAAAIRCSAVACGYEHFLKAGVFAQRNPRGNINMAQKLDTDPAIRAAVIAGDCRDAFQYLLSQPEPQAHQTGRGHVDIYGSHAASNAWVFCGWVAPEHAALSGAMTATARFSDGEIGGAVTVATYARDDLAGQGIGVLIHLPTDAPCCGQLEVLELHDAGVNFVLPPSDGGVRADDAELARRLAPLMMRLRPGAGNAHLAAALARHAYDGTNTLNTLSPKVLLEVDELIICPPNGVVLVGWLLAATGTVCAIRVRSGRRCVPIDPSAMIRLERADVLETVGVAHGLPELRNGFIAYVPDCLQPDQPAYLEVETSRGTVAHRPLPTARMRGLTAMRFLLDRREYRYHEVAQAYDGVLGPAIAALNADRLQERADISEISFGAQPATPVLSVIVPLYGRIDFMEYQFAFLSRHTPPITVELIYVLDDPPRQRDAERLAASIFQRFAIPFRLVLLSRNLGFAPANNIGLGLARGAHVCFLNSDVFPGNDHWMERMVAHLDADETLGAVGPLLLYEDDCVQHMGMAYRAQDALGGWQFPDHPGKGWRVPEDTSGLRRAVAITAACMVLRTAQARSLGGFDEAYAIGDFEDSDLCLKLRQLGLGCAVDMDTALYHLERQSQAGSAQVWRMNLTLFNAWVHERRWGNLIAAPEAAS